jgi:hypothetical protein
VNGTDRAGVRRKAPQPQAEPPEHGPGMLAGEVGRVQPGGDRERLLDRIPAAADLDKMIPDLTRLGPAPAGRGPPGPDQADDRSQYRLRLRFPPVCGMLEGSGHHG